MLASCQILPQLTNYLEIHHYILLNTKDHMVLAQPSCSNKATMPPVFGLFWVAHCQSRLRRLSNTKGRPQDVRILRGENYVRIWCARLPTFIAF